MRVLAINEAVQAEIDDLVRYAEQHPYSMDDLLDMYNGFLPPAGDNPNHVIHIPFGFRVVYSIEKQVKGNVRHASISIDVDVLVPSIEAVQLIISKLGYKNRLEDCMVEIEKIPPATNAINIWEYV